MNKTTTKKLYAKRNPIEQGQHYMDHMMAMTAEDLHSKSAIAEELAHRDIVIEEMSKVLQACKEQLDFRHKVTGTHGALRDVAKMVDEALSGLVSTDTTK